jgi:hypothetical protein
MRNNKLKKLIRESFGNKKNLTAKNASRLSDHIALMNERTDKSPSEKVSAGVKSLVDELAAAAEVGDVGKLHELLDTKEGMSQELSYILKGGNKLGYDGDPSDDAVEITEETKTVLDLMPTQNEIDFFKSTSWGLSLWPSCEAAHELWGPDQGGPISVSGNLVLDGHHRWSGCFALNPYGKIQTRNFKFPKGVDSDGQKLCALQLAVASKRKPGSKLPSANAGKGTNILGASKENIMTHFDTAMLKKMESGKAFLGEKFIEDMKETPASLKIADDLFKLSKSEIDGAFSAADIEGGQKRWQDCPVRSKIADVVADNLAGLPINDSAPARTDMPQLDHKDIGGAAGFDKLRGEMQSGDTNLSAPFLEESAVIDMSRWNKLAGLLKD